MTHDYQKTGSLTKLFAGWGGMYKIELIKFENALYQTVQSNCPGPVICDFIRKEQLLKTENTFPKIYTAGKWQRPQLPKDA